MSKKRDRVTFCQGLASQIDVIPQRKLFLISTHTLLGKPTERMECTFDDFGIAPSLGDASVPPRPGVEPAMRIPLKNNYLIVYLDSFRKDSKINGVALFEALGRADRKKFQKLLSS